MIIERLVKLGCTIDLFERSFCFLSDYLSLLLDVLALPVIHTHERGLGTDTGYEGARETIYYRRNHHTIMKNQNTMTRKTMYHSQRQPWRSAMLFMRRKVPERMPEVSAKASFCGCIVIRQTP